MKHLNLTGAEIKEIAEFAGMTVDYHGDEDLLHSRITVFERPNIPFRDEKAGAVNRYYAKSAFFTEYPEEGSMPLGPELRREAEGVE